MAVQLEVTTFGGNTTSPLMYGVLYEDIYHSGDGGFYAETIQNRAFQGTAVHTQNGTVVPPLQNLDYWHAIGGVSIGLDSSPPLLNAALPYQMQLDLSLNTTDPTGVYNDGFWGFKVDANTTYNASFYMRGDYHGCVLASFQSVSGAALFGNTSFTISQTLDDGWIAYNQSFSPSLSAPDGNNIFALTFIGNAAAGRSLDLQMISVFPETYHDRTNGLRKDLAQGVAHLNPRFLRFPGGNNLEGLSSPYRLKWNDTVGSVVERPSHPGTWGYINTNGFGLLEQLQWALDTGMTPILAVWGGLYLDGEVIAEADLQPYIDDALNELEFFLAKQGDSSTANGAMRAAYGYSDPFNINYVEIGNEDYLNGGQQSYTEYRFPKFYDAVKARYPHIKIISTVLVSEYPSDPPVGTIQDLHEYQSAASMVSKYDVYDNTDRRFPVLIGEYAATSDESTPSGQQLDNPTLQSATSEAVYFCGIERNADVILGIAHGALLKSLHDEPDNVALMKHSPTEVVFSYSYHVTKLFSSFFGNETVPITSSSNPGPVYWSGTKTDDEAYYIKVVNYNGNATTPVSVHIPGKQSAAQLYMLTGPSPNSTNTLGSTTSVQSTQTIFATDSTYTFAMEGQHSIAVLVV